MILLLIAYTLAVQAGHYHMYTEYRDLGLIVSDCIARSSVNGYHFLLLLSIC